MMRTRTLDYARTSARSSHRLAVVALFVVAALVLSSVVTTSADTKKPAAKGLSEDQKILHLLNRTGFGARPGDLERVKKMGIEKYLEMQLHPERINDAAVEGRLKEFASLKMTLAEINEAYPPPQLIARQLGLRPPNQQNPKDAKEDEEKNQREYRQQLMEYYRTHNARPVGLLLQELQAQKMIRAIYSERQLQEVLTDFWFNHFNVFWQKNGVRSTTTDYEMNAIRPHTMGKFKDLLLATAKSSAMMQYLDNFQSSAPNTQLPNGRGRVNRRLPGFAPGGQNEPMTEEQQRRLQQRLPQGALRRQPGINENYARELMELHTLGVDGGYTQKDVQEVARAFTGWTIERPFPGAGSRKAAGEFIFRPFMHDQGEKIVLGQKIAAGGGIEDGEKVIEILARHPNTAKFIATKLTRRLVSDNPPQALVDKVASTYMKTDGDIREMLKTIFTSPEFFSAAAYRAKIKTPFDLAVSAVRALGGDTINARQLAQFVAKMGQPLYLYQPPTGYPDRADHWVNTGALLERLNFGLALSANKVLGTAIDPKRVELTGAGKNDKQLLDRAIAVLLNNEIAAPTRAVLEKQLQEGVSVKGELGDPARIPASAGNAKDVMSAEMTVEQDVLPGEARRNKQAGGDAVRKAERQAANYERRFGNGAALARAQAAQVVAPEVAKVVGLVLGSPEFQRK